MENTIRYNITSALIPNYYQRFHCLMGGCRDDCCHGWRIEFDKKDYLTIKRAIEKNETLRAMPQSNVRRLRSQAHEGLYGGFSSAASGRCSFHTEDGLCRLQLECGAEVLPKVCKVYPRSSSYTTAAKEYTLTPSCEGVLQQLWNLPQGVEFVENPLPKGEYRSVKIHPGDHLQLYFTPIRALCVDILQNRSMSLSDRMLCLGIVIEQLKKENWETLDGDAWAEQMAPLAGADGIGAIEVAGDRDLYLMQNLNTLNKIAGNLNRLDNSEENWTKDIYAAIDAKIQLLATHWPDGETQGSMDVNIQFSKENYAAALEEFDAVFSEHAYFFENLMVAIALHIGFPKLDSREALSESYVALCNLYSFCRFVSVLGCRGNATKEQLFHMIVMASRATLHNNQRFAGFQKELFQNGSDTLAHMAILIKG